MARVLLAIALLVLGIVKKQAARYWLAALCAVSFQAAIAYLFQYHTGVVTPYVKRATHDGKLMEAYAMLVFVLSWGVPAFVVRCGYARKRPVRGESATG